MSFATTLRPRSSLVEFTEYRPLRTSSQLDEMTDLLPWIPTAGFAVTLSGAVYAVFRWVNGTVAKELREEVALWLLGEIHPTPWPSLARRIFSRVFGERTWTRRGAFSIVVAVYFVGSAMFFWLNSFVLFGRIYVSPNFYATVGLDDWFGLFAMLALFSVPPQFVLVPAGHWLLRLIERRPRMMLAPAILLEFILMLTVVFIWSRLALLPEARLPLYEVILSAYHWRWDISQAQLAAAFIIPVFWILIILVVAIARFGYALFGRAAGRIAWVLSQERIEKEPITLIGEIVAGVAFLLVCIFGLGPT